MGDKRMIAAGRREGGRTLVRYEDGGGVVQQNWDGWTEDMQRRQFPEQWEILDTIARWMDEEYGAMLWESGNRRY